MSPELLTAAWILGFGLLFCLTLITVKAISKFKTDKAIRNYFK